MTLACTTANNDLNNLLTIANISENRLLSTYNNYSGTNEQKSLMISQIINLLHEQNKNNHSSLYKPPNRLLCKTVNFIDGKHNNVDI